MSDLKVLVERKGDWVIVTVPFTDIDGAYCDDVRVDQYNGRVSVSWPIPFNKSVANAALYIEAMGVALAAAKTLERGGRVEDEFGSEVEVSDE